MKLKVQVQQAVISGGEKDDIIVSSPTEYILNYLSPAELINENVNPEGFFRNNGCSN